MGRAGQTYFLATLLQLSCQRMKYPLNGQIRILSEKKIKKKSHL